MPTYEGTYFLAVIPPPHKILFLIYTYVYLVGFQAIYLTLAGSLSDCLQTKRKQKDRWKKGERRAIKARKEMKVIKSRNRNSFLLVSRMPVNRA